MYVCVYVKVCLLASLSQVGCPIPSASAGGATSADTAGCPSRVGLPELS